MANFVTIAAIGNTPLTVGTGDFDAACRKMIAFWENEFSRVLPDRPDLIVVPECCDRPADYNDVEKERLLAYYRFRGDRILDYFAETAGKNRCYLVYSAVREAPDGSFRNSSVVLDRSGTIAGVYNKNHPVMTETTDQGVLCGKEQPIIRCDFGSVACAICFDLNYADLREAYALQKPDLILFSSMYHGGLMQAVWAYLCRSFFVGAIAGPANPSEIRNPFGEVVAGTTNYHGFVTAQVNLDYCLAHLDLNWDKLKEMKRKYGEGVSVYDPGRVGSVMIQSLREDLQAVEMAKEFGILLLDDYFAQCIAFHKDPENIEV